METIKIKCPFDGAILAVKDVPGIENKNVTCPICNNTYPFKQFKRVTENPDVSDGTETDVDSSKMNFTLGVLKVVDSDIKFQLKPGRNVIGRKAHTSTADFQINTGENHKMSREHIVIEVKKIPNKGFVHYLSFPEGKTKVNPTFVGDNQLLVGDCVILEHGDVIKLPGATLKFEIPDGEATDI